MKCINSYNSYNEVHGFLLSKLKFNLHTWCEAKQRPARSSADLPFRCTSVNSYGQRLVATFGQMVIPLFQEEVTLSKCKLVLVGSKPFIVASGSSYSLSTCIGCVYTCALSSQSKASVLRAASIDVLRVHQYFTKCCRCTGFKLEHSLWPWKLSISAVVGHRCVD